MRTQTMVQLTDHLVRRLDERANREGVSRSALIGDALESFLEHDRDRDRIERFISGYTRIPETDDEIAVAEANAVALVREEPW